MARTWRNTYDEATYRQMRIESASGPVKIIITGIPELSQRIRLLAEGLSDESTNYLYLAAAREIAKRARSYAPIGDHPAFVAKLSSSRPGRGKEDYNFPGRLKRSIIAKPFNAQATRFYGPGAYAQVNLKSREAAWYAHIVESGRKALSVAGIGSKVGYPRKAFSWLSQSNYRVFTRQVRGFSGRRFFERSIGEAGTVELEKATDRLKTLLGSRYNLM